MKVLNINPVAAAAACYQRCTSGDGHSDASLGQTLLQRLQRCHTRRASSGPWCERSRHPVQRTGWVFLGLLPPRPLCTQESDTNGTKWRQM